MRRISTLFPLLIVALLAIATFWLEYVVSNEAREGLGKDRHDPDSIITNFTVERFDATGSLRSRMHANKLTHYPDDDTADIEAPRISFIQEARVTTFSSHNAVADNRQRTLLMVGKVRGERPAGLSHEAQSLTTDEMTVWTDDEIARTKLPVYFQQGQSRLEAIGAEWNNITGILQLNSHVRATLPGKSSATY